MNSEETFGACTLAHVRFRLCLPSCLLLPPWVGYILFLPDRDRDQLVWLGKAPILLLPCRLAADGVGGGGGRVSQAGEGRGSPALAGHSSLAHLQPDTKCAKASILEVTHRP